MTPIPLTSFRILTKRTNWKKSVDEILNDDVEDHKELIQTVMECKNRLFDSESEEFGEFAGATREIMGVWYQYFMFLSRANVKASWISIGVSNRGIPKDVNENYRSAIEERKEGVTSVLLAASKNHQFFLLYHLNEEKNRLSKNDFFDFVFEKTYVPIIEAAHRVAMNDPFFSEKTLDFEDLIRRLRIEWIPDFKRTY
jgi:hypothetical protein